MKWCWWCCHDFDTTTLQLPYSYEPRTNKFSTCGQFCSWSCIKSYTLEKYGVTRGGQILCNIIIMRKKLYNIVDRIQAAPHRNSLKEFGGTLTIEEFRKNETVDKGVQNALNNSHTSSIESLVKRTVPKSMNDCKLLDITGSTGMNEPLRLKRPKPLKRDENNLEKTLGIVRKKATP